MYNRFFDILKSLLPVLYFSYSIYRELIAPPQRQRPNYTRHPSPNMQLQFDARFTSIYRLRIPLPPFITDTQPHDLEMKATGWSTHPSEHLKPNQISFEDGEAYIARKD
ncbi:hypothetical protein AVEN_152312-1 [Araneus ventricosus]|uniref:Uncharacterized protein n=1 Tax=Araneus ventricosus TaxID=182803 RepID=A0A4Y2RXE7_ARAVE|nr:hypothetical protein AVEN_152312-1 [Araneus ventricosus]